MALDDENEDILVQIQDTAILHWPFLKTLGPAPFSRTRPGRENGDACRARWPACAHVHVSVGCGRAIEPLPTGLHYTCTACSRPIDIVAKHNETEAMIDGRSRAGDWSLLELFSLSTFLVHLHRNHERWTPGISHIVTS